MKQKRLYLFLLTLFFVAPVFAAYNSWGIPDSSEIRKNLVENWFEAPLDSVRMNLPEIYSNDAGQKFQVRLEESESTFNIFVAPCAEINVKVYSNKGVSYERQEVYPGDKAGSWVLIRDKQTEKPLRIRYYFAANSDVYVQFSQGGKAAVADMVIFGNYASRGAHTGVPFKNFYDASFADVLKITQKSLPWSYVTIDNTRYSCILQMAGMIQKALPSILFVNDAVYDGNNELVQILNGLPYNTEVDSSRLYLSSAGFLKWIADGLVHPLTGGYLKREPLLKSTVEYDDLSYIGVLSQQYDLFFSLNWVRNLAAAVISVYTGKTYMYDQAGVDVTISPFSGTIVAEGTENTAAFMENAGYKVSILKSLLYVLGATDPDTLYFGAIRGVDTSVMPEIHAFSDCVAFLPYFDSNDSFGCFVFMNGRTMSLEDFCKIYDGDFVYLTRVRASDYFFPYFITSENN